MRDRRWQLRLTQAVAALVVAAGEALAQERQTIRRIVVSIPDRKLALMENGRVVKIYSTAMGAPSSPTPSGIYTIVQRIPNPTWYGPNHKVVGPGKGSPVGTRWMGLSRKGYGIHGTNNPRSIGHYASHGCVRMRNHDIEDLFARVAVGDVVELHGERDADVARIFSESGTAAVAVAAGSAQ